VVGQEQEDIALGDGFKILRQLRVMFDISKPFPLLSNYAYIPPFNQNLPYNSVIPLFLQT
jgi:hypothetical protein